MESETAVAQVCRFLEAHGESRFTPWEGDEPSRPTINRAGFRRVTEDGMEFYILQEAWKEICQGQDSKATARILAERGHLVQGDEGRLKCKSRLPGLGLIRVYRIRASILAEGDKSDDTLKRGENKWEQREHEINTSALPVPRSQEEAGTVGTAAKTDTPQCSQYSQPQKEPGNGEDHEITGLFPAFPKVPGKNSEAEKTETSVPGDIRPLDTKGEDEPWDGPPEVVL